MNPIEEVRQRLDGGRKWHKGNARSSVNPENVCLGVAAAECYAPGLTELINRVVVEQFPDRTRPSIFCSTGYSIPDFNDHENTEYADVELVLDKASIAWDESVR